MSGDPRDYILDVQGSRAPDGGDRASTRPFLRVLFRCCNVYQRVYRSASGDRYDARCPRCGRSMRFAVGEGGTDLRFFVVE